MHDNRLTDAADQSPSISDDDLQKQVKVLDRVIERIQLADSAREKVREGWAPRQTFWDEFIDVNCTPMGQDEEYGEDAYWSTLDGIWHLAGAYMAEAMAPYDSGGMTAPAAIGGDDGINEVPETERMPGQDTQTTSDVDFNPEQWFKPETPSELIQRFDRIQRGSAPCSDLLPSVSEVAKYEEVYPGAAEHLFALSENVLKIQETASSEHHTRSILRTVTSVMISLSMMALAGLSILYGPAWVSIPLGAMGIFGLFLPEWLRGTRSRKR